MFGRAFTASPAEASGSSSVPSTVGSDDRFQIQDLIGQGCFGSIHRGVDTKRGEKVAVKFENKNCDASGSLKNEHTLMATLAVPETRQGFAEVFYGGKVGSFYCVVMTLLSRSLEDCRELCPNKKLSVKSATLIAQQALQRIEYLHSRSIIHRDIKPENFMMGSGTRVHHLYLIDFGLSCPYMQRNKHIGMKSESNLIGTARYASVNAHRLCMQSRRDDLEAICYMIIYCLRGSLPWSGLKVQDTVKKYAKIGELKHETQPSELCKGMPEGFAALLTYTRSLDFTERPDYQKMQMILNKIRKDKCPQVADHDLDWLKPKDKPEDLVPIMGWEDTPQPDDLSVLESQAAKTSCFRWRSTKKKKISQAAKTSCFRWRSTKKKKISQHANVVGGTE